MGRKWVLLCFLFLSFSATGGVVFAAEGDGIDTGTTAWMLTSTALVLLMVPGLAMFYGGLVRTKNVLGTMMHAFSAMAIMSVLWVVCGYCMSFGENVLGGWFGWNPDYLFLVGIDETIMEEGIPEYIFSMFQGKFAIITPALIAGAFAERVTFKGYAVFIALWGLFVWGISTMLDNPGGCACRVAGCGHGFGLRGQPFCMLPSPLFAFCSKIILRGRERSP